MKKILFVVLLTSIFSCKAQILPVEEVVTYIDQDNGLPNGTKYIRDVNNLFSQFLGTWIGSFEDKTLEIRVTNFVDVRYNGELEEDILIVRYKITDINGVIMQNVMDLSDDSMQILRGRYLLNNKTYRLSYYGPDFECGEHGNVYLTVINETPNQLTDSEIEFYFTQVHDSGDPSECLGDVTFPFPIETPVILTKQ